MSGLNALSVERYVALAPPFTPGRHKKNRFHEVLRRDRFMCCKCKTRSNLTIHHRIPRSVGGSDEITNLETLCADCHVELHRADPEEPA